MHLHSEMLCPVAGPWTAAEWQDVTQQVRIVDSYGKKQAIIQLLHEAGLLTPGTGMGR